MAYKGTIEVLGLSKSIKNCKITLNSGAEMPVVGLGTYTVRGFDLIFSVVEAALEAGYRSFDTAAVYGNEQHIGQALKKLLPKYNLKREDIFLTSKLAPRDQGKEKVDAAIEASIKNLSTDYLDLYLIHWPGTSGIPEYSPDNAVLRNESWQGLIRAHKAGTLKSIGVSNYTSQHLEELRLNSPDILPAVNQVEFHPHFQQTRELYTVCASSKILLQAYSSFGGNSARVLQDETVEKVANQLNKQPAQVLLRWALQRGFAVIPKSTHPDRIKANIELDFVLSTEAMDTLNNIQIVSKYAWNPDAVY